MMRDMPLFAYRAKVEDLADKRTGEPMYGDSIDHAAITLRNIFSRADGAVKILTGDLNEETYGRKTIVNEVENFLKDGSHSLQILYEEENLFRSEHHPLIRAMKDNVDANVEWRHVPTDIQDAYKCHFVLTDDDSYRFEPDRRRLAAIAVFGDESGGRDLGRLFSALWNTSRPSKQDISRESHSRPKSEKLISKTQVQDSHHS